MNARVLERCYVVTGGPGSGKTTLLSRLADLGYDVLPEAGRGIIRAQSAIGGPGLPWQDRVRYHELMLSWEMRSYEHAACSSGVVFADRGIPDIIGSLTLEGLPVPGHVRRAATEWCYAPTVFIAPPWPAIFTQDAERHQSRDIAEATYESMSTTYRDLGYDLVELPRCSPDDRTAFVLGHVVTA